jgi:hypothetical protein
MIKKSALCWVFLLSTLVSCYKNHLYVQQEWVDPNFLASSKVGTPDPRQANPPTGQRLLVGWRFPQYLVGAGLKLVLTARLWDNSEEVICRPIEESRGSAVFKFYGKKILTYRFQVVDCKGDMIETWEHHFWTELIDTDLRGCHASDKSACSP